MLRQTIFATLFFAVTCAAVNQEAAEKGARIEPVSGKGQRRALLIGVNDYESLAPLKFCEADATALRDALVKLGFHPGDIKLLTTGENARNQPTRMNIEEHLDSLFEGLSKDDMVLISMSGHGGQFTYRAADGKIKEESFFCPKDARTNRPDKTMISTREIYDRLDKCPANFKLLLIDACRNEHLIPEDDGGRSGDLDESRAIDGFSKSIADMKLPKGTVALISCAAKEKSYESPKLKQGVFMYHVVQGSLGKADADGDGIVTLFELRNYVIQQTTNYVFREFDRRKQNPFFHSHFETADFGLFRAVVKPGNEAYAAPRPKPTGRVEMIKDAVTPDSFDPILKKEVAAYHGTWETESGTRGEIGLFFEDAGPDEATLRGRLFDLYYPTKYREFTGTLALGEAAKTQISIKIPWESGISPNQASTQSMMNMLVRDRWFGYSPMRTEIHLNVTEDGMNGKDLSKGVFHFLRISPEDYLALYESFQEHEEKRIGAITYCVELDSQHTIFKKSAIYEGKWSTKDGEEGKIGLAINRVEPSGLDFSGYFFDLNYPKLNRPFKGHLETGIDAETAIKISVPWDSGIAKEQASTQSMKHILVRDKWFGYSPTRTELYLNITEDGMSGKDLQNVTFEFTRKGKRPSSSSATPQKPLHPFINPTITLSTGGQAAIYEVSWEEKNTDKKGTFMFGVYEIDTPNEKKFSGRLLLRTDPASCRSYQGSIDPTQKSYTIFIDIDLEDGMPTAKCDTETKRRFLQKGVHINGNNTSRIRIQDKEKDGVFLGLSEDQNVRLKFRRITQKELDKIVGLLETRMKKQTQ